MLDYVDLLSRNWIVETVTVSGGASLGVVVKDVLNFYEDTTKTPSRWVQNNGTLWGEPSSCTPGVKLGLKGKPKVVGDSFTITYDGVTLTGHVFVDSNSGTKVLTEIGSWTACDPQYLCGPRGEADAGAHRSEAEREALKV